MNLLLAPEAESLQSLDRTGGCLFDRHIEALHRLQQFTDVAPEGCRRIAEGVKDIFLSRRFGLGAHEGVPRVAANRLQRNHVLRPKRDDRTIQKCLETLTPANLASDWRRQPRVRRALHVLQCFPDPALRKEIQVRRLPELDGQRIAQRVVEHGIARLIRKVGQQNRVLLR